MDTSHRNWKESSPLERIIPQNRVHHEDSSQFSVLSPRQRTPKAFGTAQPLGLSALLRAQNCPPESSQAGRRPCTYLRVRTNVPAGTLWKTLIPPSRSALEFDGKDMEQVQHFPPQQEHRQQDNQYGHQFPEA